MRRRNFFQWFLATVIPFVAPRWARAQNTGLSAEHTPVLRELAGVVLPASLGKSRTDEITSKFIQWIREYKAGAEMSSGYGFPRTQTLPANPSTRYAEQLRQIETAAAAKGEPFAKLDAAAKRAVVEAALEEAKIDRIPPRPNGKHVAADLMSYFYNSAEGEDFLYNAAIKRDDCRGLSNSGERPAPLN